MLDDFNTLFIERSTELKNLLSNCLPIYMYSDEEIIALSLDLCVNTGQLRYRIQSRNLNTQAIGTGEENYEEF